jgi:hypothetical protein
MTASRSQGQHQSEGLKKVPNLRKIILCHRQLEIGTSDRLTGWPLGNYAGGTLMTKLKLLVAAAVLSTAIAGPAMAQQYYPERHVYHRGPVGAAADTAAGIAGAAVGTAAAIATAPFRNSYDYYDERYNGPAGYACQPGTWFRGADGRQHICQ